MRRLTGVIIILVALILTSCSPLGSRVAMLNRSKDDEKADARAEQIVDAIKKHDRDALKSLYSEKALEGSDNFDDDMETFFDFIQGKILSWESDDPDVWEHISYGKRTRAC